MAPGSTGCIWKWFLEFIYT